MTIHGRGTYKARAAVAALVAGTCGILAEAPFILVRDRKPVAGIVIPDKPVPAVTYAAAELQYHVSKSSGATLRILPERDVTADIEGAVYLGATRRAVKAGIDPGGLPPTDPGRPPFNSFIIRRAGPDLVMAGNDTDGRVLGGYNATSVGTLFAVYELLENHLGVRWLWPGVLGEHIPRHDTISVGAWDQTWSYPYQWAHLREKNAAPPFKHAQDVWLKRHRFSQVVNYRAGHSFVDWWKKYGEAHPGIFARLPDGSRRPLKGDRRDQVISMCVSNPELWGLLAGRYKGWSSVPAGPNDTAGACTCERCRAWDAPDPRFDSHDYWSDGLFDEDSRWCPAATPDSKGRPAPSLANRYARFYLAVQECTQEALPTKPARVRGLAYANYKDPPVGMEDQLNERIYISLVPGHMFPFTDAEEQAFRDQWDGWYRTGASLLLRPNFTLCGHNLPIFYARQLAATFAFARERRMVATDFDSLTGQWAAQGPTLYVLGRMHVRPQMTVDEILAEYYSAFGPAEEQVRAYFGHWEKLCASVTTEQWARAPAHGHSTWYAAAAYLFTPEVMRTGRRLLERALSAAGNDRLATARVEYLELGLRHAELTLRTQAVCEAYNASPSTRTLEAYRKAMHDLAGFRRATEGSFISNMQHLVACESSTWDQSLLLMQELGEELAGRWRIRWDPERAGVRERWFAADEAELGDDWQDIEVGGWWKDRPPGRRYREQHGEDYSGVAWYRRRFTIEQAASGNRIALVFGAVDAACDIWLNGKKVLERPFPYNGNENSWAEPFEVDVSDVAVADRQNVLTVRVDNISGPGGIWKPVRLVTSAAPPADAENLIVNGSFESGTDAWRWFPRSGKAELRTDDTQVLSGSHAAMLTLADRATANLAQRVSVPDGASLSDYTFSMYVRTSPEFTGRIQGHLGKKVNAHNTGNAWRQVTLDEISSSYIGLWVHDATGTVWFDHVTVTKRPH